MSGPTGDEYDEDPEVELDPPVPRGPRGPALPEGVGPAVEALPGLARVAASAWWHTTEWGVRTSARAGRRVARAVADPDEAAALARDATEAVSVLGDLARAVSTGVPLPRAIIRAGEHLGELADPGAPGPGGGHDGRLDDGVDGRVHGEPAAPDRSAGPREEDPAATLRRLGAELLERSRDVWSTDTGHPAYERILGELAPDEARILLLLLEGGPQPSVDVRTGGPIGMVSSQLIAPGLTMIGARAGCRWTDQVPAYLNNLFRLGLVWFSRESLRDPMEYQVLEAQPDVLAAVHSVKFARVVRRSIHLTPFGEDFCRAVLLDPGDDRSELPSHQVPEELEP